MDQPATDLDPSFVRYEAEPGAAWITLRLDHQALAAANKPAPAKAGSTEVTAVFMTGPSLQ